MYLLVWLSVAYALILTNQLAYQGGGSRVFLDGAIGMSIEDSVELALLPDHSLSLDVSPGGHFMLVRQGKLVSVSKVQPLDIILMFAAGDRLPFKKRRLQQLFRELEEREYLSSVEQFIVEEVHGKGITMAVAVVGEGDLDLLPHHTHSSCESEWTMAELLANGTPLSYHQPLLIQVNPAEGIWHEFAFGGQSGPQPIRWIVKGPMIVDLVDRYCPGDRFAMIMDDRWLSDPTTWSEISDQCDRLAIHSHGTYRVESGYHRLQLVLVETPFGGGRGAIRFSNK